MISTIVSRLVILLFGTLYPAYASYKAVRTKNVKEYVKWMMYWIVFALFTSAETFTDVFLSWFPFYYEIKIILVLWLLSPATKGSSILYRKFVHPMLSQREQEIDEYIAKAKEQGYTTVLNLGTKGVNYATNVIMQTAIKGGGGIVNQLKKSYSLGDLSGDSDSRTLTHGQSLDGVDHHPMGEQRIRKRRSPHRSASERAPNKVDIFFPEVDIRPGAQLTHMRSTEDISSGYSSAEPLYAGIPPKLEAREGLVRTASVGGNTRPRTRTTRATNISKKVTIPEGSESGESSEIEQECDEDLPQPVIPPRKIKKIKKIDSESSDDNDFLDTVDFPNDDHKVSIYNNLNVTTNDVTLNVNLEITTNETTTNEETKRNETEVTITGLENKSFVLQDISENQIDNVSEENNLESEQKLLSSEEKLTLENNVTSKDLESEKKLLVSEEKFTLENNIISKDLESEKKLLVSEEKLTLENNITSKDLESEKKLLVSEEKLLVSEEKLLSENNITSKDLGSDITSNDLDCNVTLKFDITSKKFVSDEKFIGNNDTEDTLRENSDSVIKNFENILELKNEVDKKEEIVQTELNSSNTVEDSFITDVVNITSNSYECDGMVTKLSETESEQSKDEFFESLTEGDDLFLDPENKVEVSDEIFTDVGNERNILVVNEDEHISTVDKEENVSVLDKEEDIKTENIRLVDNKEDVSDVDKEDSVQADKEDIVRIGNDVALVNDDIVHVGKEIELIVDKDVMEVDKDVADVDKKDVVHIDKEIGVHVDKEDVVDVDKEYLERVDKEDVLQVDKEDVLQVDKEDVLQVDKEDVLQVDKEDVLQVDKEDVLQVDKETVTTVDKEENLSTPTDMTVPTDNNQNDLSPTIINNDEYEIEEEEIEIEVEIEEDEQESFVKGKLDFNILKKNSFDNDIEDETNDDKKADDNSRSDESTQDEVATKITFNLFQSKPIVFSRKENVETTPESVKKLDVGMSKELTNSDSSITQRGGKYNKFIAPIPPHENFDSVPKTDSLTNQLFPNVANERILGNNASFSLPMNEKTSQPSYKAFQFTTNKASVATAKNENSGSISRLSPTIGFNLASGTNPTFGSNPAFGSNFASGSTPAFGSKLSSGSTPAFESKLSSGYLPFGSSLSSGSASAIESASVSDESFEQMPDDMNAPSESHPIKATLVLKQGIVKQIPTVSEDSKTIFLNPQKKLKRKKPKTQKPDGISRFMKLPKRLSFWSHKEEDEEEEVERKDSVSSEDDKLSVRNLSHSPTRNRKEVDGND